MVFRDGIQSRRDQFLKNGIEKSILSNLKLPLNSTNEDRYEFAFYTLNLLQYKDSFVNKKVDELTKSKIKKGISFQQSFLELLNNNYPGQYSSFAKAIADTTKDSKLLAMAIHYAMPKLSIKQKENYLKSINNLVINKPNDFVLKGLQQELKNNLQSISFPNILQCFLDTNYLPGQTIVFSLQRKNRNYPGIAIVRKPDGHLLRSEDSSIFYVGQLARSLSNMPSYISMGNTPQGIFRMNGFASSKSYFIGPTPNIQMTLPVEYKASNFYMDSTLVDTIWTTEKYASLLPKEVRNYSPMFESFIAGKAGRNEIIAHGTTVDPNFYVGQTYFPFTPTNGCLTSVEFWNPENGKLMISNQWKLYSALRKIGNGNGYLIVMELNDNNTSVGIEEVEKWLQ